MRKFLTLSLAVLFLTGCNPSEHGPATATETVTHTVTQSEPEAVVENADLAEEYELSEDGKKALALALMQSSWDDMSASEKVEMCGLITTYPNAAAAAFVEGWGDIPLTHDEVKDFFTGQC